MLLLLALLAGPAGDTDSIPPRLLESVSISRERIAFSYAGQLWEVPHRPGSPARASGPGRARPVASVQEEPAEGAADAGASRRTDGQVDRWTEKATPVVSSRGAIATGPTVYCLPVYLSTCLPVYPTRID